MARVRAGPGSGRGLDRLLARPNCRATNAIVADLVVGRPISTSRSTARRSSSSANAATCATCGPYSRGCGPGRDLASVVLGLAAILDRPASGEASGAARRRARVGVVVLGVVALVAFDALFETFHRIFFPAGSYPFDPTHGPARPALPVRVLAGDRDGGRRGDRGAVGPVVVVAGDRARPRSRAAATGSSANPAPET